MAALLLPFANASGILRSRHTILPLRPSTPTDLNAVCQIRHRTGAHCSTRVSDFDADRPYVKAVRAVRNRTQ